MEGNFPLDGKNRRLRLWRIPVFLSGAFLIGLCGFLRAVDSQTGSELVVLLLMGTVFCLAAVLSGLYNRKGYIYLKNGRIQARYHWLGRLDCAIEDIAFVLPQINTLTILLKSGRRHIITGVADSWLLSRLIRRRLYAAERELPDSLRQELNLAKAKRAKTLTWVICGTAMLFVNILLTVLLLWKKPNMTAGCGICPESRCSLRWSNRRHGAAAWGWCMNSGAFTGGCGTAPRRGSSCKRDIPCGQAPLPRRLRR